MSFTENLYLKRMIQQLHEENLKLKSFINEALRDPRKETTRPLFGPGSSDLHPTNPLRVDDADTGSAAHPGEEGAVDDMPTNPFPVTPSNTFKPKPFSPYRPHPHFPNPYREKIRVEGDIPSNPFPVRRTGRSSTSEKYSGPEFGHSPSESKPMYEPHPLLPRIPSHRQR